MELRKLAYGLFVGAVPVSFLGPHWIGLLVAAGGFALLVVDTRRESSERFDLDQLDPDTRILARQIIRLVDDVQEKARRRPGARELGEQAARIQVEALAALARRKVLVRALGGRGEAEAAIVDIHQRLLGAITEEERGSLTEALKIRRIQLQHFEPVQHALDKLDKGVSLARLALEETLAAASANIELDEAHTSQLKLRTTELLEVKTAIAELDQVTLGES